MRGTVIYAPGDIRSEQRPEPEILAPTDAIIRTAATCVCGSDLWPYRGANKIDAPAPIGHEYIGFVEEVGSQVENIKPGQFVIGSFFASDNTCPICRAGYQTSCLHRDSIVGCQSEYIRIPLADGTLVPTPATPDEKLYADLLTLSDVMGTGWYAAVAAEVKPGSTVAVVGDGAVGLCAVLAARELGADRVIAMSRHASRARLATEFGATDIVAERGEEGVRGVKELTDGLGADCVLECVGTDEAMRQALDSTRPGGNLSFVGVPHGVNIPVSQLFSTHIALRGGTAPVRDYLPDLIDRVWKGSINPGRVFDLTLPLEQVAEAYRAMDERRAIKVLLQP
jgi:threonine dehydrogenase-like Zn-dependent dehydrogenase